MYTIKYNRTTNHIDGLAIRTTGGGKDMGDHVSDYSQNPCGSLTRYSFADGKSYATVAEALHAAETGGRKLCRTCKAAAEAMITAEAAQVFAETTATEEATPANVVSYNGGKVHSPTPLEGASPFPFCRTGDMTNSGTKYRTTGEPVTCKVCLTYAERRTAAPESATITDEAPTNQGETMAETTTLDITTDEGAAALEQIDANIERARSLAESDNGEALEELGNETEAIISKLSGKGSIKAKKERREDWKKAATVAPKAEVKKVTQGTVQETAWQMIAGVPELVNSAAEKLAEGVNAHLRTSHVAKEVAEVIFDAWTRIPNGAGRPDILGDSVPAKEATRAALGLAGDGFEDNYDNRQALKKLMRSVQDQRSDVRAEWLRSLDEDTEEAGARRAIMASVLENKPEDVKASEWVANTYGTSTIGQTEKRRLEYQAKKELEAKGSDDKAEGIVTPGEGDSEGAEPAAPVNPDDALRKVVAKLYKDVESADVDAFERASEDVKAEERKRLETIKKAVTEMIATLL